ncbi:hypothetical protein [Stakelama tenebrarum]|uniref:Uncharacterized protein n=1 Tax=Stakelama tenebrarum TaxID=2711215 RepID=A0A6G6Y3G4_9SPHN|nr:hypothetical protein [Sphingosinithalassobacter tenebrarum]QIG79440.1 hypothetical protein G5C33_06325 [Sphingosinithalassobacter tenebrarum]
MEFAVTLLGVGSILIAVIQSLRLVLKSDSYRRRSLNLTLGVTAFFLPIAISLILLSAGVDEGGVNFLVAFSGIGGLVTLYFFGKAALHT